MSYLLIHHSVQSRAVVSHWSFLGNIRLWMLIIFPTRSICVMIAAAAAGKRRCNRDMMMTDVAKCWRRKTTVLVLGSTILCQVLLLIRLRIPKWPISHKFCIICTNNNVNTIWIIRQMHPSYLRKPHALHNVLAPSGPLLHSGVSVVWHEWHLLPAMFRFCMLA